MQPVGQFCASETQIHVIARITFQKQATPVTNEPLQASRKSL